MRLPGSTAASDPSRCCRRRRVRRSIVARVSRLRIVPRPAGPSWPSPFFIPVPPSSRLLTRPRTFRYLSLYALPPAAGGIATSTRRLDPRWEKSRFGADTTPSPNHNLTSQSADKPQRSRSINAPPAQPRLSRNRVCHLRRCCSKNPWRCDCPKRPHSGPARAHLPAHGGTAPACRPHRRGPKCRYPTASQPGPLLHCII